VRFVDELRNEGTAIVPPSREVSVIRPDSWLQVKALYWDGRSRGAFARELGVDRRTVRLALVADRTPAFRPAALGSRFDSFEDCIRMRLADGVIDAVRLLRELEAQGYTGSVSILRDWCAPLRVEQQREASL
jgi:transposase